MGTCYQMLFTAAQPRRREMRLLRLGRRLLKLPTQRHSLRFSCLSAQLELLDLLDLLLPLCCLLADHRCFSLGSFCNTLRVRNLPLRPRGLALHRIRVEQPNHAL